MRQPFVKDLLQTAMENAKNFVSLVDRQLDADDVRYLEVGDGVNVRMSSRRAGKWDDLRWRGLQTDREPAASYCPVCVTGVDMADVLRRLLEK
jgi:hypothetical protein